MSGDGTVGAVGSGFDVGKFVESFPVIAEAEGGIERLRGLVLELALRGRLVSQCCRDVPARTLLDTIQNRRRLQSPGGAAHRDEWRAPLRQDEAPRSVPAGWEWVRLGSVIDLVSGQHLGPNDYSTRPGQLPYFTGPSDFGPTHPVASRWTEERRAIAKRGDVLLTVKGAGVGKTNLMSIAEAAISRQLMAVRSTAFADGYLSLVLRHAAEEFHRRQVGIAIPGIGRDDVISLPAPIPPMDEQKRIVAKVDELMRLIDDLEAKQNRQREAQARWRNAALDGLTNAEGPEELTAACERVTRRWSELTDMNALTDLRSTVRDLGVLGRLTHSTATDGTAAVELEVIAKERAQALAKRVVKADREPREVDETEPPIVALPETWCWVRVKQLAACVPSAITDGPFGTNLMTKDYIGAPGFKVVRLGNIGVGHYIEGKDAFITAEHYRRLPRHHVESGDLLVAGLAEPVCRACIAPAEIGPALVKADCFRMRVNPRVEPRYLMVALNSNICRLQAEAANHGITRTRINLANFKAVWVPLPPLAEQRRIVAKVDQLMALCDALEAGLRRKEQAAAKLAEAVVAELVA